MNVSNLKILAVMLTILLSASFINSSTITLNAQSAYAFCTGSCPEGCGMYGFDYQACGSAGCLCTCEGGYLDDPLGPIMTEYNCEIEQHT